MKPMEPMLMHSGGISQRRLRGLKRLTGLIGLLRSLSPFSSHAIAVLILLWMMLASGARPAAAVVTLVSFTATPEDGVITVRWETATEINQLGFVLHRSTEQDGEYVELKFFGAEGGEVVGAVYTYTDTDVQPGITYWYKLESMNDDLTSDFYGPISATLPLPATPTPSPTPFPTPTPTTTPSPTPTTTPWPTPTATATPTPTAEPGTPDVTPTETPTPWPTVTPTFTRQPTPWPWPTVTPTFTRQPTRTSEPTAGPNTPTSLASPTPSPTAAVTPTPTSTPILYPLSPTPSPLPLTSTPIPSDTPTPPPTATPTHILTAEPFTPNAEHRTPVTEHRTLPSTLTLTPVPSARPTSLPIPLTSRQRHKEQVDRGHPVTSRLLVYLSVCSFLGAALLGALAWRVWRQGHPREKK